VVFLDIVKAFDRVPHSLLMYKLLNADIVGNAWGWLKAFLRGRMFRVGQGGLFSDWHPATAGVPQGCVLSPLLFAIYINDLDNKQLRLSLSLFADDVAAWPTPKKGQTMQSKEKILNSFLQHVHDWSLKWGLQFSTSKSQLVLFSGHRADQKEHDQPDEKLSNPPSGSSGTEEVLPRFLLSQKTLPYTSTYKYLGLWFSQNGRWEAQFDATIAKCKITANLIARQNHRNHPPSPVISIQLVQLVLIPQLSYCFAFWRLNESQKNAITQVLASSLRRALAVYRGANARELLWEAGIPDVNSLRLRCLLQTISRAARSAGEGRKLPQLLVDDVASHKALVEEDEVPDSALYCQSFAEEAYDICEDIEGVKDFPMSGKQIRGVTNANMTMEFLEGKVKPHYKHLKPQCGLARYISVDSKPTVCVRARLRMGVALTPKRHHLYKHTPSPQCDCGTGVGDIEHIILHCPKFAAGRSVCEAQLQSLSPSLNLSVHLALGGSPPKPLIQTVRGRFNQQNLHDNCLSITGRFLLDIDRLIRL
jgi:hypothetical protein